MEIDFTIFYKVKMPSERFQLYFNIKNDTFAVIVILHRIGKIGLNLYISNESVNYVFECNVHNLS